MASRVPVILQAEATECGLAAVAMIAAAHGRPIELTALRERCSAAERAPTLHGLGAAANMLGLSVRPVTLGLAELRRLELPAILHWDFDHFVVVTRVRRRGVIIHDPACGRRRLSLDHVSRSFTGVAVECRARGRGRTPRVAAARPTLRRMVNGFPGVYRYLGLMLGLLLASHILALAPPVATQLLIDEIVLGQDQRWRQAVLIAMGLMAVAAVSLDTLRRWYSLYTGTRLARDSTAAVIEHLLSLPAETLLRRHVGDLVSRIESLRPIRRALVETCTNGAAQVIVLGTTLVVMAIYSTTLTLLSLGMLGITTGIQAAALPRAREYSFEALIGMAKASNSLIDSLRGFGTVYALGIQPRCLDAWQGYFFNATNSGARATRLGIAAAAGQGVVAAAEQVLFLAIGLAAVAEQRLTLGVLFAFLALRARLGTAAVELLGVARELYLLSPHVHRVGEIMAEQPEAAPVTAVTQAIDGRIRCEDLCYRYPGGEEILDGFNAEIATGEFVIVAGDSGAGKSTLLKLLAGSLRPGAGRVLVDDFDLRLWRPQAFRRQLGVVLQNDCLLAGTLGDNISCFDATPDLDRIREVSRIAAIWQDIEALPMGLDTPVTNARGGLSGGQAQRILIARALYRRPRLLLLDEATNQLDRATERRVLDNLRALKLTVVGVAHSDAVLALAHRVLYLSGCRRQAGRR